MPLERRFHIGRSILQSNARIRITLRNPLIKHLRDPQQLLLARLPNTDHDRPGHDPAALLRRRLLLRLVEMLLDTLEERVDLFADVFRVVFFDDLFERGTVVAAVAGDFGGRGGFEEAFDAVEVVLRSIDGRDELEFELAEMKGELKGRLTMIL